MSVGVVYDPIFLKHDTGEHPENAKRLEAITGRLKRMGTWDELEKLNPRPATADELKSVHSPQLIELVEQTAARGGGAIDPDTVLSEDSYQAALFAAGSTVAATEAVVKGNVETAFALVRPPGHHATRDRAMGFCLFNNIAVAGSQAISKLGLSRVLILDWDVHHGNGTQDIFEREPRVCYISLHEFPHYPGTGQADEKGSGNLVNIPLPAGCGDEQYLQAMDEIVAPVAQRFKPELILVSAGFDGHWADPLASMKLSITGYAGIARRTLRLAQDICQGRLALTLEGGYNLTALAGSAKAVIDVLLKKENIEDTLGPPLEMSPPDVNSLLSRIKRIHSL